MSAVLEETKSANLASAHPKPKASRPPAPPQEPPCPISVEGLQAFVDFIARDLELPTVKAGAPPLEEYFDEKEGKHRRRPRKACKLDEQGNVVPFSGPVIPDDVVMDLWNKIKPHVEQEVHRTVYAMSESTLVPGRNGEIDERSQVVKEIRGRFVIADAQ
jgi:hypothetical protein